MPFVALREDDRKRVKPSQTDKGDDFVCPHCNEVMYLYDSFKDKNERFVASHFKHAPDAVRTETNTDGGCSGGESNTHMVMKEVAQHRLEWDFEGEIAESFPDNTFIGENMPDAGIRFNEPKTPYGKGILVEVQYKNEGKDIDSTTQNYLQEGYSVCWLTGSDFDGKSVDILTSESLVMVWPAAVPRQSEWGEQWDYDFELDATKIRRAQSMPYYSLRQRKRCISNRARIHSDRSYTPEYVIRKHLFQQFLQNISYGSRWADRDLFVWFSKRVDRRSRNEILNQVASSVWDVDFE